MLLLQPALLHRIDSSAATLNDNGLALFAKVAFLQLIDSSDATLKDNGDAPLTQALLEFIEFNSARLNVGSAHSDIWESSILGAGEARPTV